MPQVKPYWQQRQEQKLKGSTSLPGRAIPRNREKSCKKAELAEIEKQVVKRDSGKNSKKSGKKTGQKKRIKNRAKKQAKRMRQLAKINKELLQDGTLPCEIQSPVCIHFATVVNHNAGRVGDQLLNKKDMTRCCPPCNDYIEAHHEWARERGFKKQRHGKKDQDKEKSSENIC